MTLTREIVAQRVAVFGLFVFCLDFHSHHFALHGGLPAAAARAVRRVGHELEEDLLVRAERICHNVKQLLRQEKSKNYKTLGNKKSIIFI